MKYRCAVSFDLQSDGTVAVAFPAFPEIVTYGLTRNEARATARDALRCHLEGLRKDGVAIPPEMPARESVRDEIVIVL